MSIDVEQCDFEADTCPYCGRECNEIEVCTECENEGCVDPECIFPAGRGTICLACEEGD